ncbi:hypothetical protein BC628DRAFT_684628 [Trametes gibbosa]|nr:hypothetical protein BC628DRAFT_684628 [Trametes gibbosa]
MRLSSNPLLPIGLWVLSLSADPGWHSSRRPEPSHFPKQPIHPYPCHQRASGAKDAAPHTLHSMIAVPSSMENAFAVSLRAPVYLSSPRRQREGLRNYRRSYPELVLSLHTSCC